MLLVTAVTFFFLTYQHISIYNDLIDELVKFYAVFGLNVNLTPIELNAWTYLWVYLILVISFALTSFLWYYVTHISVMIVGGKKAYDQTYKAMSYSLSADYLSLPAFIVSLISLSIWLSKDSTTAKVIFIISSILYFIPAFYRLYMRLVGLEKLQKISKWRAFFAAYILAYIIVFGVIFIIDVILISIVLFFR